MDLEFGGVVWLLWNPHLVRKPLRKRQVWRGPPRYPAYRAWIRRLPCSICSAVLASRSRSYRFGRENVDEGFRLLLYPALQELPYGRERGISPDWKADVREDLPH